MRTTFRIFAAAAAAALGILTSCQQQGPDTPDAGGLAGKELVPVTLTASFIQTKAAYEETAAMNLKPTWEADDKVIGFDEDSNNYEFIVASVAADGSATLTGEAPANCTLHLIYLYGADKDNITSGSLSVNYDAQAGDKTMPAVMLADGEVTFGAGDFHFCNAGAVIGIDAVKGVPEGSAISKITVSGSNLSAATVALSGSALALTATPAASDAISTAALSGITVTDANGTLSSPVFIAVPAGAEVSKVSVATDKGTFDFTLASPSTLAANQYTYVKGKTFGHAYVEIGGLKWATMNVGATTVAGDPSTCYGDYFAWGETAPYYSAISRTSASTATFTWKDGLTDKTKGYDWSNYAWCNGTERTLTKYNTISSYGTVDNKTVLESDDDAASVNWGSGWRMPTLDEFAALRNACTGGTGTGSSYPMSLPATIEAGGVYWVPSTQTGLPEYTGVAGLLFVDKSDTSKRVFFPAAGYVLGTWLDCGGSFGCYWSSSLDSAYPNLARRLVVSSGEVLLSGSVSRIDGFTVRPVSD